MDSERGSQKAWKGVADFERGARPTPGLGRWEIRPGESNNVIILKRLERAWMIYSLDLSQTQAEQQTGYAQTTGSS